MLLWEEHLPHQNVRTWLRLEVFNALSPVYMQPTQLSVGAAIDHRPKGVLLAPLRVKSL